MFIVRFTSLKYGACEILRTPGGILTKLGTSVKQNQETDLTSLMCNKSLLIFLG